MRRNQYAESKYRRTKSWQSNPEYDKFLACSSMSDLVFLKKKREKDLNYFRQNHNLGNPDSFNEYKILQQTYKMICEELKNRSIDYSSELNQQNGIISSYIEGDDGNIYLQEDEEEDDDLEYNKSEDWKVWCNKKGLDTSEYYK